MKEISESWREPVTMTPIGVIRTPFNTREETPKDGKVLPEAEGELIVELGPVPRICTNEACSRPLPMNDIEFCPYCGERLSRI